MRVPTWHAMYHHRLWNPAIWIIGNKVYNVEEDENNAFLLIEVVGTTKRC